jgi:hypothetical protein
MHTYIHTYIRVEGICGADCRNSNRQVCVCVCVCVCVVVRVCVFVRVYALLAVTHFREGEMGRREGSVCMCVFRKEGGGWRATGTQLLSFLLGLPLFYWYYYCFAIITAQIRSIGAM